MTQPQAHSSLIAFVLLMGVLSSPAYAQVIGEQPHSLAALQGGWWADCEAPAVEFFIRDSEYSGDFEGSFEVTLTGDVLVFEDGFADGHSTEVTHEPLAFRILDLADGRLVLRPLAAIPGDEDWHLQSCDTDTDA